MIPIIILYQEDLISSDPWESLKEIFTEGQPFPLRRETMDHLLSLGIGILLLTVINHYPLVRLQGLSGHVLLQEGEAAASVTGRSYKRYHLFPSMS